MRMDKKTQKIGQGKPGPGRPKGMVNKTTALLKDAILKAAQEAGGGDKDGIEKYLTRQAEEEPRAFMGLLGKVLPMQVVGDDNGGPVKFQYNIVYESKPD